MALPSPMGRSSQVTTPKIVSRQSQIEKKKAWQRNNHCCCYKNLLSGNVKWDSQKQLIFNFLIKTSGLRGPKTSRTYTTILFQLQHPQPTPKPRNWSFLILSTGETRVFQRLRPMAQNVGTPKPFWRCHLINCHVWVCPLDLFLLEVQRQKSCEHHVICQKLLFPISKQFSASSTNRISAPPVGFRIIRISDRSSLQGLVAGLKQSRTTAGALKGTLLYRLVCLKNDAKKNTRISTRFSIHTQTPRTNSH